MKKIFLLAAFLLVFFTSCSGDDQTSKSPIEPPVSSGPLVKKMIHVDEKGDTTTTKFTYNGNKILFIEKENGYKSCYTYTENLITNLTILDEKGAIDYIEDYTYTEGKLSSRLAKKSGNNFNYLTEFTHNSDGTISYESFSINKATNHKNKYATAVLKFVKGNLIAQNYNGIVTTYQYDTNNYPFKNVLGFNLLLDQFKIDYLMINNNNNMTKASYNSYDVTTNYSYNAEYYPIERKCIVGNFGDSEVNTTHFFYK